MLSRQGRFSLRNASRRGPPYYVRRLGTRSAVNLLLPVSPAPYYPAHPRAQECREPHLTVRSSSRIAYAGEIAYAILITHLLVLLTRCLTYIWETGEFG